jgi:hypothetical protein
MRQRPLTWTLAEAGAAPNSFNKRSHGTSVAVALPATEGPSNQILIVINSPGWIDI